MVWAGCLGCCRLWLVLAQRGCQQKRQPSVSAVCLTLWQFSASSTTSSAAAPLCSHWALHSGARDPFITPLLKTSHMDHHYVNDTVGYGISSTLYDMLFGTLSPQLLKKMA